MTVTLCKVYGFGELWMLKKDHTGCEIPDSQQRTAEETKQPGRFLISIICKFIAAGGH